ncbi:MAG: transposase [Calditrichaeota bacterium]|nr:transposase [Calditrichota bacterium]
MQYDPQRHHRRSIRLKGYDYSQPGWYFVTVIIQDRIMLLGNVIDEKMVLNDAGQMIQTVWDEIPKYYPGIKIDVSQIMPNHFHGIIQIVGADPRICPLGQSRGIAKGQSRGIAPTEGIAKGQSRGIAPTEGIAPTKGLSLPDVVQRFKTLTTKRYIDGVKQNNWPRFNGKLWQRNYWEHIIRNELELNRIRRYIIENPKKWNSDRDYSDS